MCGHAVGSHGLAQESRRVQKVAALHMLFGAVIVRRKQQECGREPDDRRGGPREHVSHIIEFVVLRMFFGAVLLAELS